MKLINGKVSCTQKELQELKDRGFNVSMHTEYYTNGIVANAHGFSFGFFNWLDNLEFFMNSQEVGYYSDAYQVRLFINSQEDLDKCLNLMDALVSIKHLKSEKLCSNYEITNRKPLIQPLLSSTTKRRKQMPSWYYPRGRERALS